MDSVLSESIWQWDPKVGDLYQATTKPWETVVEVGSSPDVQIALSQLGIGAKDSPNHLVAGFPRSFPQDSWSWGNGYEKRYIYFCVIVQKTRKNHKKNKKTKKKIMSGKEMYERNPFSSSFLVPSGKRKRMQRKRLFGEHHFTQSSTYPQTVKWHVLFSLNEEKQKKRR